MNIKIYKCVITTLGDATSTTSQSGTVTVYSYIELASGEMIKKFAATTGLNGNIIQAMKSGDEVELHVMEGTLNMLLCFRGCDGRLFAPDLLKPPFLLVIFPWVLILSGIPLIIFFGLGLVPIWAGWKIHRLGIGSRYSQINNYLNSFPNVIRL